MSKISRSKFQKVVEENKRLIKDIRILTAEEFGTTAERILLQGEWAEKFEKEKNFWNLMHEVAKEYIREHRDELPDFLTETLDKEVSK